MSSTWNNGKSTMAIGMRNGNSGKKDDSSSTDPSAIVARQGHSKDRVIQSSHTDLVPSRRSYTDRELLRAGSGEDDNDDDETIRTQQALQKIVDQKLTADSNIASTAASISTSKDGATYIRYKSHSIFNKGNATQMMERIIKIVDKQNDPMLPQAKYKITRAPEAPPSPPAPVLHDMDADVATGATKAQQNKDWHIPAAISNWKNEKGFAIAIDKRMSYLDNDKSTNTEQFNENFANLSEALLKAEQDAREEIKLKNEARLKLQEREQAEKELKLQKMVHDMKKHGTSSSSSSRRTTDQGGHQDERTYSNDYRSAKQRELAREERRRKAEREIKLSKLSNADKMRQQGVSERVIRGVESNHQQVLTDSADFGSTMRTGRGSGANSVPLANNNSVYDSDLFQDQDAIGSIYTRNSAIDGGASSQSSAPVQFEKDEIVALENKRLLEEQDADAEDLEQGAEQSSGKKAKLV